MKLLLTYFTDRFSVMRQHWAKSAGEDHAVFLVKEHEPLDLGGKIILFDLDSKTIGNEISVRTPFGADYFKGEFFVTTGSDDWHTQGDGTNVRVYDKNLRQLSIFSNPLLNDSHGLHIIPNTSSGHRILVASTGIDSVIGMNTSGTTNYIWSATHNGYNQNILGETRNVDLSMDHRTTVYTTPYQTTHVNTVSSKGKSLYFTLWRQGEILEKNTGDLTSRIVCNGLSNPHSFYPRVEEGFIVSDTRYRYPSEENSTTHYGRVVLFDNQFRQEGEIRDDFCWVQDARSVSINGKEHFIVADSNNSRLLFYDSGLKKIDEWKYDPEWKIATVTPVYD